MLMLRAARDVRERQECARMIMPAHDMRAAIALMFSYGALCILRAERCFFWRDALLLLSVYTPRCSLCQVIVYVFRHYVRCALRDGVRYR